MNENNDAQDSVAMLTQRPVQAQALYAGSISRSRIGSNAPILKWLQWGDT